MWGGNERFEVRRRLGEGGMGVVYEAYDRDRNMLVAVKALRHVNSSGVYRFKREFRSLTGVSHPNLISLYELFSVGGQWFFTMELVEGDDFITFVCGEAAPTTGESERPTETLSQGTGRTSESTTLDSPTGPGHGTFDPDRLRSALLQLSEGIAALHDSGHLHQDIKPSNVMVTKTGRVILLDFGVITELGVPAWDADASDRGGTPAYMAPERYGDAHNATEASDWYSVGVMLYRVLVGQKPFAGKQKLMLAAKRRPDPPAPNAHVLGIPDDLNELCVALLNPDPSARPRGGEVLARLKQSETNTTLQTGLADKASLLIGREHELAELGGALDRTRDQANIVFLSGSSGMGKSALVRSFVDDLANDGEAIVLAGRCYERETVPYKAVDSLIDALYRFLARQSQGKLRELLPRDIRLLARMFPVLEQLGSVVDAPKLRSLPAPRELRRGAFEVLRQLLRNLTVRRSLVLAIDDLQWGDVDSAELIDAVMRPPDSPPLLLIVSYRAEDAESSATITSLLGMSAEWEPHVRASHVVVDALSTADSATLAARLMGRGEDDTAVRSVLDEAGGHPYLIQELAHFASAESTDPSLGGQVTLDQVLLARVNKLPAAARRVLELVAVADRPTRQTIIEAAAAVSRAERTTLFQALESERLVRLSGLRDTDTIAAYHNRLRETITARLNESERRRHHNTLALAIKRSDFADPESLTVHFAGAGKNERAGHYAALAARQATESLAFDRAAEFYRTALNLGDHEPGLEQELKLELADALGHAGRGVEAADAFLKVAESAERVARMDYQREAARQLLVSGHLERGLDTIKELLADVHVPYPATPQSALIKLLWNRGRLRVRGLRWKARTADDIPATELARLDVEQSVADGLAMADNIRGAYFQTRALRRALDLGEETRIARAFSRETVFLASVGGTGLTRADQRLAVMREISERTGHAETRALINVAEGFVRYFGGRYREAQQCFHDAEMSLRQQPIGSSLELNNARLFRLFAFRRMGAFKLGRRLMDEYVRDAQQRGDLYAETSMRRACNFFWLVADEPDEAARDLDRTLWTPPATGFHLQHWYELEARGELALYRGVTQDSVSALDQQFEALRKSMLTRVQVLRVLEKCLRARMVLALPDPLTSRPRALSEVSKTANNLAKESIGYATALSLLLQAAVASHSSPQKTTVKLLTKAAAAAEATDLHIHAAAARRRRATVIGGSEGEKLLTQADRYMREHGVVDPERITVVLAPGFKL